MRRIEAVSVITPREQRLAPYRRRGVNGADIVYDSASRLGILEPEQGIVKQSSSLKLVSQSAEVLVSPGKRELGTTGVVVQVPVVRLEAMKDVYHPRTRKEHLEVHRIIRSRRASRCLSDRPHTPEKCKGRAHIRSDNPTETVSDDQQNRPQRNRIARVESFRSKKLERTSVRNTLSSKAKVA